MPDPSSRDSQRADTSDMGKTFCIERFYHVLWRDTDTAVCLSKIKTSLGDILVTKACKDFWFKIENINDLSTGMTALISIVDRLMHSTVLCGSALRIMWQSLERVHNTYGISQISNRCSRLL